MSHTSESVRDWLKYLTRDELQELKRLAQLLPDNPVVVNIGAGGGTSGLAFMESRADLQLWTIDKTAESSPYGCLAGEQAVFESAGFWGDPRHTQIHGLSQDVGRVWDGPAVDLVFVDGDHTYEGCKGDIDAWEPQLKPGGLLAFHDYDRPWAGHEVELAVDERFGDTEPLSYVESLRTYQL